MSCSPSLALSCTFFHERRDKADLQHQLQLAIGTAKSAAEAATKATESANQAILSAQQDEEARRIETELQLPTLRLDAPAKAALQQRASVARATSAQAIVRSKELDSQSKAAAQQTEKGLSDLTQIAREKGIIVPGISTAPITGPVNDKTDAAPAPPVAPPRTEPAVPAETKPVSGNYKETYKKAIEAKNQKQWQQAEQLFETALKQNGSESTERINISGFGNVEPYVPKYYLGVVFKNLNNCPAALKQWEESEHDNAIQKTNLYKSLLENRDACAKKQ